MLKYDAMESRFEDGDISPDTSNAGLSDYELVGLVRLTQQLARFESTMIVRAYLAEEGIIDPSMADKKFIEDLGLRESLAAEQMDFLIKSARARKQANGADITGEEGLKVSDLVAEHLLWERDMQVKAAYDFLKALNVDVDDLDTMIFGDEVSRRALLELSMRVNRTGSELKSKMAYSEEKIPVDQLVAELNNIEAFDEIFMKILTADDPNVLTTIAARLREILPEDHSYLKAIQERTAELFGDLLDRRKQDDKFTGIQDIINQEPNA